MRRACVRGLGGLGCGVMLLAAAGQVHAKDAPKGPAPAACTAPPSVLRIYIARHGQTAWNALRKLQGISDIPLNEVGRAQAAALVERLAGVPLDKIYTSALSRSRMTAEGFGGRVPVESLSGLNEQALGAFEGTLIEQEPARWAELQRRRKDPADTLDGGESHAQAFARVRKTVDALVARHRDGGTVLVIGHGGTNALILRDLLSLTDEQAESIKQDNDEVYLVELDKGFAPRILKLVALDKLGDL